MLQGSQSIRRLSSKQGHGTLVLLNFFRRFYDSGLWVCLVLDDKNVDGIYEV